MGRIVAILRQLADQIRRRPQNQRNNEGPGRAPQSMTMTEQPRLNTFTGALARAALVSLVVILPALVMPSIPPETAQVLLLLALFAGGVTLAEYTSSYPALVEFRFAAPFNRTRFALLTVIVVVLALLQRQADGGIGLGTTGLADSVAGIAALCGQMLDLPFSPVRQVVAFLPDGVSQAQMLLIRDGASLGLVLAVTTLAGFLLAIQLQLWPMGQGPFNVWINLPTFEPTAGNDVVLRLQRHARVNIALGLLMPYLLPGLVMASALMIRPLDLTAPVSYVWGIALWAFIPAALVMRGVAMARVARMIRANRRRYADADPGAFASV